MKGTVKFFDQKKGFGFIFGEDGKEYHCHAGNINGPQLPQNRDEVEFEPAANNKGLYAKNVVLLNQPQQDLQQQSNQNLRRRDEREQCMHCGKYMMPRMSFQQGQPHKSFCPFCGNMHKQFSGCFIATAVYGDYDAPEVVALRRFRDEVLQKSKPGRFFIKWYYRLSPSIAKKLKGYPTILRIIQVPLDALSKRYK